MTHRSLSAQFEAGRLDNSTFGHGDHIRVIWEMVHAYGELEAIRRFERGLRRLAASAGHPEKFHATITYAFGFLVADRVAAQGVVDWRQFETLNPDLFEWPNRTLADLYPNGELTEPKARDRFVLPSPVRVSSTDVGHATLGG